MKKFKYSEVTPENIYKKRRSFVKSLGTKTHIKDVASMCLSHRLRRDPLDETGSASRVERALNAVCG